MKSKMLGLIAIAVMTGALGANAQIGFTHLKQAPPKPLPATGTSQACILYQGPEYPPVAGKEPVGIGVTALPPFDCTDQGLQNPTPTGKITIYYGEQPIASKQLNNGTADFYLSSAGVPAGTYTINLVYSGDSTYLPQSIGESVTLIAAAPTGMIVSSYNPWVVGDVVNLNASIFSFGYPPPLNGAISFTSNGQAIGSVPLNNLPVNSGVGLSVPSAGWMPGTYSIIANYSGDSFHAASSSAPFSLTLVANSATTTTLAVSPAPPAIGDVVTLTAQVDRAVFDPPYGVAKGNVQFVANGTVVATLPLVNGTYDQAVLHASTVGLKPGTYSVVAKYLGTKAALPSSSDPQLVTLNGNTTTTLTISPNPVTPPATTFLYVQVSKVSGSGVPTGSIAFSYNGTSLGSSQLGSNGSVQVPLATGGFSAGTYAITAVYSGDTNNGPSSATATLNVQ